MSAVQTSPKDRMVAGSATAIIMALFGIALVRGLAVGMDAHREQPIALLDLRETPPPPPIRKPPVDHVAARRPRPPAPANLKNVATPVVVPPPIVLPIAPPHIVVAQVAGVGAAASAGAGDQAGPGTGAGGAGNGDGGGGDGDGDETPPRQIGGRLKASDLPPGLRSADQQAVGTVHRDVAVRYTVEITGRVSGCRVTGSSGSAELDALACRLIEQRFRFAPSRDSDGQPVRSTIVETHSWLNDREDQAAP